MRLLSPTIVLSGLILLAGCAAAPQPTPTRTPTPTPTALTQPEMVQKQAKTMVSLYSQIVCTNLEARPEFNLDEAVDEVLARYATTGLTEESRIALAQQVMQESAAKDCPEQSARIAADLAEQPAG